MKTSSPPVLITFVLACIGLLPKAQAVVPQPDGGYPNFNTAEGQNALFNLTTGVANTGVGWFSLFSNTDGSYNTAVGAGTLVFNVGDQLTGDGTQNTAIGTAALLSNTIGASNTATGVNSLSSNTGGSGNTATGVSCMERNTIGGGNTATGKVALWSNTEGGSNTAMGVDALFGNTTGDHNTGVGAGALATNATGNANTALGFDALTDLDSGENNAALGFNAGGALYAGYGNLYLGAEMAGSTTETNHTYVRNINTTTVSGMGTDTVTVNLTTGLLGHSSSSRRYKQDIKPMEDASETVYRLKPVTYRYRKEIDPSQSLDYGLVAEDVSKVDPNLTNRNRDGQTESVRYNAINAMLLNEFLKEHRKVEEHQATITQLKSTMAQQQKDFQATAAHQKKQIDALTEGLQKVSAQLELNKLTPQTVKNID